MRSLRSRIPAALLVGTLALAACGTQVDPLDYQAALEAAAGSVTTGGGSAGGAPVDPANGAPIGTIGSLDDDLLPGRAGSRTGADPAVAGQAPPGAARGGDPRAPAGADPATSAPRAGGSDGVPARVSTTPVEDVITIGMHVPVTGAAPLPMAWRDTIDMVVEYTNREAPIHGRQIRFVVEDDAYDSARALAACRKLAASDPILVLGYSGPNVVESCADYFDRQGIPYLTRGSYLSILEDRPLVFYGTTADDVQAFMFVEYLFDHMGGQDGAFGGVYEAFPGAAPLVRDVVERVEGKGGRVVAIQEVPPRNSDFSAVIQRLRSAGADTVLIAMAPVGAIQLAVQSHREGYRPTWVGLGSHWNYDMVVEAAGAALDGAIVFSSWATIDSPAAQEFRRVFATHRPDARPDDIGLIVWGWYSLARAALEATGPDLSRASLLATLQDFSWRAPYWNPVAYRPGDRSGSNQVTILRADGQAGRWRQITGFQRF